MAQDVLRDNFVQLCIDPSLNFYDGKCRVLVEGQMTGDGDATADALRPLPSDRNLEDLFGLGSQLTESLKLMFCMCPTNAEFFVIPRADPIGGVEATFTLTVTGSAATDGRIELFALDGKYNVDFHVEAGQSATQIAAAIASEYTSEFAGAFPYDVTSAAGVVTFTAKNAGTVGNYLNVVYNWRNMPDYPPAGVAISFASAVAGTGDLTALNYASILGGCCYSCYAILGSGSDYQESWQEYLETLWSCDTPQCFGHGYTYNVGTLGQILPRATNAAVFSRIAHCMTDLSPPYFKAAAYAALSCCTACSSPELNVQGQNYGVLNCLNIPESCSMCFTPPEQQQLKDAGFVVTGPLNNGSGAYTSPYIFNDITNYLYDENMRPNATFRDTSSRRLAAATAIEIGTELQGFSGLALFTKNTDIKQGIFGTTPRLVLARVRAFAKSKIGILFSEFENIDNDIQIRTDAEMKPPCQGKPGKLHLFFKYRPPVRIEQIVTTLQPELLLNCNR
jgi:phage tail sheath gpL-like